MSDAVATEEPRLQYCTDGTAWTEAGEGGALVLIHGVGMNRAVWGPQIEHFARDYRVVAYDMLGHGDSPPAPENTRLADLRGQLTALLDELGIEHAYMVGHSMGALVALDCALHVPQRVQAVVALNAVYRRSPEQRAAVIERARRLLEEEADEDLEETLDRWFCPEQRAEQPERVERVRYWLENVDRAGYARVYNRFAQADDVFVGRLQALCAPVLFATGERDPNSTPEMSRRMANKCPYGELLVLPRQRHMMAFMDPGTINPLIAAFLQRTAGGARQVPGPA